LADHNVCNHGQRIENKNKEENQVIEKITYFFSITCFYGLREAQIASNSHWNETSSTHCYDLSKEYTFAKLNQLIIESTSPWLEKCKDKNF
jgi:hypothetical protein